MACLLERGIAGLGIEPIQEMLGFKSAGLAKINFHDVEVPSSSIVGKPGFALSHLAPVALQYGRLSTACSAVGLLRACFEESVSTQLRDRLASARWVDRYDPHVHCQNGRRPGRCATVVLRRLQGRR